MTLNITSRWNQMKLIEAYLQDVKAWMTNNFLLLNSDQNWGYSRNTTWLTHKTNLKGIIFSIYAILPKYFKVLSLQDAEKQIHAFITLRLDYCNALLSGCSNNSIKSLQLLQNTAAQTLTRTIKYKHISRVLASLQWLPVKSRIDFKVLRLIYKALNGLAPNYLKGISCPLLPVKTTSLPECRSPCNSKNTKNTKGGRALCYWGPHLCGIIFLLPSEMQTPFPSSYRDWRHFSLVNPIVIHNVHNTYKHNMVYTIHTNIIWYTRYIQT